MKTDMRGKGIPPEADALMAQKLIALLLTAAALTAGCGVFACKNDCPSQPPVLPPGHTALVLTPVQTSTRWLTLEWKNDSTAVSRAYVLLRNNKDTVYNATAAADTVIVKDSLLTPSTTYNYELYRIYQNQHWDSAMAQVKTLDTTKDNYTWTVTKIPGAFLFGVWGLNPNSVWAVGGGLIVHYLNGQIYLDTIIANKFSSIAGTSDTDIWIGNAAEIDHWNGSRIDRKYAFNGDSLPSVQQTFSAIWIAPDSEIFFACSGGSIVHRSANGKWDTMTSGTTLGLYSIIGFAPNDIYAAGGYGGNSILLKYDGISWNTVLQYPGTANIDVFGCVWGDSPDSLYMCGDGVFHRKGNIWEDRTPQNTQLAFMEDGAMQGWNNVFICGDFGLIMKFDGEKWKIFNNYFSLSSSLVFNRMIQFPNDVFIVGDDNNNGWFVHGQ